MNAYNSNKKAHPKVRRSIVYYEQQLEVVTQSQFQAASKWQLNFVVQV